MSASPDRYRYTFEPAEGRVRIVLNETVIADSTRAMVMRETRLPPVFYFPFGDIRMELADKTEHRTYCPFKGNASYWSFRIDGQDHPNLMWGYETPYPDAAKIAGYAAFYSDEVEVIQSDQSAPIAIHRPGSDYPNPLVRWLIRDAPSAVSGRDLTAQLAEHLLLNAVPVMRLVVIIRTLHPQVVSFAYRWRLDDPDIQESQATYMTLETPEFLQSPLLPIFEGAGGIRRRLEGPDPILDFPILEELRREGATDYVAMPMTFVDGTINALTITSDRSGGFSTTHLGQLYEILDNLGRLFEVHATRRKARTLLDTYLGPNAGARVLSGQIKRGDGDNIRAVIWYCDLRESTPLATSLSRDQFLAVLNEFFDAMAGAVIAHDGQVLRFIGDAALAIFPMGEESQDVAAGTFAHTARTNALAAAVQAAERMKAFNEKRRSEGHKPLQYGLALHAGEVTYGNIGTHDRLEFTVIGEAANRAARIEGMCKRLNEPILLSAEFAAHFPDRVRSVGEYRLRGLDDKVELFALNN